MRIFLSLIILVLFSVNIFGQSNKTINFEGVNREYKEYVPAIYTGTNPVPVVFCLHGLGDNMNNFSMIGMHQVADTANFIVITPQALNSIAGTAWNSGASYYSMVLNGTVNDIGFLLAILDSLQASYNIDVSRVYACGFSMGGFMANRLACEATDHFAAIASVSGTIGASLNCSPWGNIPVCHFHGTNDSTVYYQNNMYGSDAEDLVDYWVNYNNCDTAAIHTALPDLVADGKTVDHYFYGNGDNNSEVEFYKINGGGHEWLYQPINDITYTTLIWDFFRKHSKTPTSIHENPVENMVLIYPNPANDYCTITYSEDFQLSVFSMCGDIVYKNNEESNTKEIMTSSLSPGVYILQITSEKGEAYKKLVIH